jgi:hypothetical protein
MGVETAIALAGLGISAYQGIKGAQATAAANSAAEKAANEALKIQEADKFKSLQVPTLGLELAQQNIQARQAQELQGLQDIGAAGVLGGLTALNQQGRAEDLALSADAQQMQYQRDMAQAQNAQQIEQGRMQREFAMNQAKLAGAQQAAAEGKQQVNTAIAGGLSSLSNAATLNAYQKVNGVGGSNGGSNFLGDIGYALGLGGTNATPIGTTMVNAQDAFKPTINSMAPSGIQTQVPNIGAQQSQANLSQSQQLNALRDPQMQFDKQYRWNPYLGQWGLRQ